MSVKSQKHSMRPSIKKPSTTKPSIMSAAFDLAPKDKHADLHPGAGETTLSESKDRSESQNRDLAELDSGLEGTFPASDPVSVTQPSMVTGGRAG